MLDEYDDPIKLYGAWGTNPPYWDQKKDGSRKLRYALWSMRFVQYLPDGAEVDHEAKPPRIACLRVGRFENVEQTATWNSATFASLPQPPPGVGWQLYRKCGGYCFWRRAAPERAT